MPHRMLAYLISFHKLNLKVVLRGTRGGHTISYLINIKMDVRALRHVVYVFRIKMRNSLFFKRTQFVFFLILKPASSIAPSFNSHSANFIKGLIKSLRTLPRFLEAPGSNLSRTVKRLRATMFILAQSAVVWHWELWEVRSLSKTNLT